MGIKMVWTDELPTKPGFYWIHRGPGASAKEVIRIDGLYHNKPHRHFDSVLHVYMCGMQEAVRLDEWVDQQNEDGPGTVEFGEQILPPRWTTKLPTKSGLYWTRCGR